MTRRRVLIVQPSFQPPGGGNGVAAWILHALQDRHELGVLTWTRLDLAEVNRFYGSAVHGSGLHRETVSAWLHRLVDRLPFSLALFRMAALQRKTRRIASQWDVLIAVNNEFDFGRPGIQYIHYPAYQRPRPLQEARWYHGSKAGLRAYYYLADRIGDTSFERLRGNLTLANSEWTGRMIKARHRIESVTVYPPVHTAFNDVPWEQRHSGFLCLGRISPEKRHIEVIDILSEVRRRHPGVTLRIVGTLGHDAYGRQVRERILAERTWVTLDDNLTRDALVKLLPTYRYGIHGMVDEHFGMAPAEMVAAGCIVFLPRGGGQVEIVDHDERLAYESVEDAAQKIRAVLDNAALQATLRSELRRGIQRFSIERFLEQIRTIVDEFPVVHQR